MKSLTNIALAGLACTVCATAEPSGILTGKLEGESAYEQLMSAPVLYQNKDNPWVQQLAIVGQLQTQYAYGSDANGKYGTAEMADASTWGDLEVRRFRLGMKGKLFKKLFFLNLTDLYPDLDPQVYKRTPETYVTWMENEAFNVSVGKTELKFNREQEYSSRDLPVFERTALGNMLYGGELSGAWICGEKIAGGWLYYLGAFSNERRDELPRFDGGEMTLAKIGYNYGARVGLDTAIAKLQWLHNTEPGYRYSANDLASPLYANCFSLSNEIAKGRFGHTTELLWGDGVNGRSDVGGISAMTTWKLTEKVQLINMLDVAASSGDNGVLLPARYESLAPGVGDKSGDRWLGAYAGVNYHIDGQRLKLMTGVQFSHMNGSSGGGDFNGCSWLTGMRMAF